MNESKTSKLPQRLSAYAVYNNLKTGAIVAPAAEPSKSPVTNSAAVADVEPKKKIQKEVKNKVPVRKDSAKENLPAVKKVSPSNVANMKENADAEIPAKVIKTRGRPKKKRDLNVTFEKEDDPAPAVVEAAVKPKRKKNETAKNTGENLQAEQPKNSKHAEKPVDYPPTTAILCKFAVDMDHVISNNFQHLMSNLHINAFDNSQQIAKKCFEWLIYPITEQKFLSEIWENEPLYIKRSQKAPDYYANLFSTNILEKIIENNDIIYGVNLDVTKYENQQRLTLNLEGRVYTSVIWDFYQNGASLRLLNPQSYSDSIWRLTSTLQEFFHTFVGANVYLTPPDSQGFAPHYDDIEAFILQLEGCKRWSVYKPSFILPRYSSPNFKREELGELIMTVDLKPGDLLYLPRGYVHEASCVNGEHSLHITISSTQLNSYADLLEKALPLALKAAIENDVEFRRSLPVDYPNYMGVAYEDVQDDPRRRTFQMHLNTLMKRLVDFLPADGACDQMVRKFVHDSQPPSFSEDEKSRMINGDQFSWNETKQRPERLCKLINLKSQVRLVRKHCLRIIIEGDNEPFIYYNVENSRVYHAKEERKREITAEEAEAVEFLIKAYPSYCPVSIVPLELDADKVALCRSLFELRLLMTKEPLEKAKVK